MFIVVISDIGWLSTVDQREERVLKLPTNIEINSVEARRTKGPRNSRGCSSIIKEPDTTITSIISPCHVGSSPAHICQIKVEVVAA